MAHSRCLTSRARHRLVAAAAAACVVWAAPDALAAHRARLSADLADHLAAGSQTIDVIVHGTRAEVDGLAARYNLRVKRYLKSGAVFRINAGQLAALQQDEAVDHLSSDIPIRSTANVTAEAIGADQVWAGANGVAPLSGAGVGVAVIDSGVDTRHAGLRNRIAVSKDFIGGDGVDRFGHGTHVAGIIAGEGGRFVETADYRGIASGARIINLRVLDDAGAGYASDVIEAIDWAIDNRRAYNIRVINLSLGAPVLQPYRDDPLCEAVERAVAAGLIVVAAAGNYGQTTDGRLVFGGITSPGNDPSVITVGALDTHGTAQRSDDTVARYSSKGPTRFDLVLKPDLVAPGSRVVSAEAAGSSLATTYAQRHVAGAGDDAYIQLSGTSMAAGVVSGTVALLVEVRPRLSVRDAKSVLQFTSSFDSSEGLLAMGAGSLNTSLAAQYVVSKPSRGAVKIGEEQAIPSRIVFVPLQSETRTTDNSKVSFGEAVGRGRVRSATRFPNGHVAADTIYWGTQEADTIYWGTIAADTIYWGTAETDTIYWGTTETDTIYWGTTEADTIYWGTHAEDTIYWGTIYGSIIEPTAGD